MHSTASTMVRWISTLAMERKGRAVIQRLKQLLEAKLVALHLGIEHLAVAAHVQAGKTVTEALLVAVGQIGVSKANMGRSSSSPSEAKSRPRW